MARTHEADPPGFRQQRVELVKSARTPSELAREYGPAADSIRNWAVQSERDAGARSDGLSTDDLLQLRRLRRENKQLRTELVNEQRKHRPRGVVHHSEQGSRYTSIAFGRDAKRMRCGSRMSAKQQLGATSADRRWGHANE